MKTKEDIIKTISKEIKKNGYDTPQDWKYIIKHVRKNLNIKSNRKAKSLPVFLTITEVTTILKTAYNLQNSRQSHKKGLIVETLIKTGARNAELCNLRVENIDFQTGLFKIIMGKGSKDRFGVMPPSIINKLSVYLNGRKTGFLFINERGNKFSTRSMQLILQEIRKQTEINKEITPHTLRHTFATILKQSGIELRDIQKLLGHEDISTTTIYEHMDILGRKDEILEITERLN
jgi:integrase/recombinase XerD